MSSTSPSQLTPGSRPHDATSSCGSPGEQQATIAIGGAHDLEGREQGADALVVEHTADECEGHRAVRLGDRAEMIGVDPGAGNDDDVGGVYPDFHEEILVVGILHQAEVELDADGPGPGS